MEFRISHLGVKAAQKKTVETCFPGINWVGMAILLAIWLSNPAETRGQSNAISAGRITGCANSIVANFKPDTNTTVTLVKAFKKGEILTLTPDSPAAAPRSSAGRAAPGGGGAGAPPGFGGPLPTPPTGNDVCVVKILIGPGHPGPVDAPSTSAGIGVEVWLPSPSHWNNRVHVLGGGGCSREGDNVVNLKKLGGVRESTVGQSPANIATEEGAVSAMTDTGHTASDCSFAMNPDGSINTVGWIDFAQRAIHEEVMMARKLAQAYYGKAAKYTYWDGFSTGGRQGEREAQANPTDVNGILAGAPAMNWNRLSVSGNYPSIIYQRELGGVALTANQRTLMGNAAINACDTVGGVHLGYIPDPATCAYDPTKDHAVLCAANGGSNATPDCVTPLQADTQNRIWYGQTADGTAPSPAKDTGWSIALRGKQLWYGHARGSTDGSAGAAPFGASLEALALQLENPKIAAPSFHNAIANGENGYKNLSFADLAAAIDRGDKLQPQMDNIDTNDPDLSKLKKSGTKMIHYHGLADPLIPAQGSINYYNRVAAKMGGFPEVQKFYRFYLVPGMAHGLTNGTTNRAANPPLPTHDQLYQALTDWVEKGIAPTRIDIYSAPAADSTTKSRPICPYPQKATYRTGDPTVTSSYGCS